MNRDDLLFCNAPASAAERHQLQAMDSEIATMDANRLLNTNVDDLAKYMAEKYRIEVPALDEANMRLDHREAQRDVSGDPMRMAFHLGRGGPHHITGTEFVVEIPFTGDAELFKIQPNTFDSGPPYGQITGNVLVFRHWTDRPQQAQVRGEIDRWLAIVRRYLQWHQNTFKAFNDSLAGIANRAITQRRQKLLTSQELAAGLGIPLKRRPESVTTYSAPEVKRKIAPRLPPATSGTFKPEPVLEEAEYQHILDVIEGMVQVMERSPKAFHDIDEETLRTHFLVQLNGHYEGQATGETFNYQGKTDILIRSGDRNIFIAECKFWGGPAKLTETIDQLLGYLSWRDSKAAVLLFNRNRDFSKVLAAIPDTVKKHPNSQKDEGRRGDTGFRYSFRHKEDTAKVIHVTILAFDVPAPVENGSKART